MQRFLWKLRSGIQRMMVGRNGVDSFARALIYAALFVNLLALIPALSLLTTLSMAMIVFALFRVFSKNRAARIRENTWYINHIGALPKRAKQAYARFKNRKAYLYFDCPGCHAKLRVPRGKGDVTVTCGRCGQAVRKTA